MIQRFIRWLLGRAKERTQMIWVGDGMSPANPYLLGKPVEIDGRKGRVVDTSLLTITVEWE